MSNWSYPTSYAALERRSASSRWRAPSPRGGSAPAEGTRTSNRGRHQPDGAVGGRPPPLRTTVRAAVPGRPARRSALIASTRRRGIRRSRRPSCHLGGSSSTPYATTAPRRCWPRGRRSRPWLDIWAIRWRRWPGPTPLGSATTATYRPRSSTGSSLPNLTRYQRDMRPPRGPLGGYSVLVSGRFCSRSWQTYKFCHRR